MRFPFLLPVGIFVLASVFPLRGIETELSMQATKAALDEHFPEQRISYLVLDGEGREIAHRWDNLAEVVSPGSLVKPFTALAYAAQYGEVFPHVICKGKKSLCWLPAGHGEMNLEHATAESCNAYFLQLAKKIDAQKAEAVVRHYGLVGVGENAPPEAWIGLQGLWQEQPLALSRAYLQLSKEHEERTQQQLLEGMRLAVNSGTARDVGTVLGSNHALAKTGTAKCAHHPRAEADGFTLAMYPAEQPRLVLLLRVHGVTGAQSASIAARMLVLLGAVTR